MNGTFILAPYNGEAGGEYVLWTEFRSTCRSIIKEYQLEALDAKFLPQRGYPLAQSKVRPWPCGGIKGPHLHYGHEVYPLEADQWMKFTTAVINDCQARLEKAMTVPHTVSSIARMGEAVSNLPIMEK